MKKPIIKIPAYVYAVCDSKGKVVEVFTSKTEATQWMSTSLEVVVRLALAK